MIKRITLQALGEDDEITRLLCHDTVCGAVLWRILLGGEDELSISIGSVCDAVGIKSKSVVKRRLDWLEGIGIIRTYPGESKWEATTYHINYDSKLFVKKRSIKKGIMEVESNSHPFEDTLDSKEEVYENMLNLFIDRNREVHGKKWFPRTSQAREDWLGACKKILEFEGMTLEKYADVVDFLASQYKDFIEGNKYAMQVQSIPNMMLIQQNKSITKLESALDKMENKANLRPDIPRHTASNMELLKKRANNVLNKGDTDNDIRRIDN